MDNIREKLVELIKKVPYGVSVGATFERYFCEKIADHLIANGVTVQEWIPIKKSPPKDELIGEEILVSAENRYGERRAFSAHWWGGEAMKNAAWFWADITHWMPMPQPPKGE